MSEEHNLSVQIVRSLSHWSGGLEQPEHSILNAYYSLIDNAKHYIIIQNQFFISCAFDNEEFFLYNKFNHKKMFRKVYNE
jgi:phosphatidylserine/phosphatidylglycerophosphate/cardiolipin synthase-like enzyme